VKYKSVENLNLIIMEITYPKSVAIGYYAFVFLAIFLYSVEIISVIPIAIGLICVSLFFTYKAFIGFFNKSDSPTIDFLIYYGIAIQLSLQTGMLVGHNYRLIMLYFSLIVFIAVLFVIYRFKRQTFLIPMNILIHFISFNIYSLI
jgi:hypothetical protein